MKKGQVLIILVLVMGVALTIGVAISSRVILTLRQTAFSGQAVQAIAHAEAGAEDALLFLKTSSPSCPTVTVACDDSASSNTPAGCDLGPVDLDGNGTSDYNNCIRILGGGSGAGSEYLIDLPLLERDQVIQIDLTGYPANTPLDVYWTLDTSPDNAEEGDQSAVELTLVYLDAVSGQYQMIKEAYDPDISRRGVNGLCTPGSGPPIGGKSYRNRVRINNSSSPAYGTGVGCEGGVGGGDVPPGAQLLRIRGLYNSISNSVAVSAPPGTAIPAQGFRIVSVGFSGLVQRTIEIIRTKPALAGIFDYVLFSGSETNPLQK